MTRDGEETFRDALGCLLVLFVVSVIGLAIAADCGVFCSAPKYQVGESVTLSGGTPAVVTCVSVSRRVPRYTVVLPNAVKLRVPEEAIDPK